MELRTGFGWDSHRTADGRKLILGGVEIESSFGLDGHSDADVLTHAVIDALLGAAGLGDIGEHFPDTAEEFKGADSIGLLKHAVSLLERDSWRVSNVDSTIVMEKPKLSPYKKQMAATLADVLGISSDLVNVKATTAERLDAVGRGEGAVAMATVLLLRGH